MRNRYQYTERLSRLSEEEVVQYKDFKSILDKRTEHLHRRQEFRKKLLKAGVSIAILAAISTALILWEKPSSKMDEVVAIELQNTDKLILKNQSFKIEIPKSKQTVNPSLQSVPQISSEKETLKANREDRAWEEESSDNPDFQLGYERAVPIVGMDSLSKYLNTNLQYPEEVDKTEGVEGSVNVTFRISEAGEPTHIEIQNSLGKAFDEECIRLISKMPEWKPATRNGKAVDSRVSLQLSFKIDKENIEK